MRGICKVNGCQFHVLFIQVHVVDTIQQAVKDPHKFFDALSEFQPGICDTMELPGFEGEWVMVMYPWGK